MRFNGRWSAMGGTLASYFLVKLHLQLSLGCKVESKAGSHVPTKYYRGISDIVMMFVCWLLR